MDVRERILEVATELFAARGADAVGLREIAAQVGVDVATVHHHAGSKAELYEAVFARMYAAEQEALGAAAARVRARIEDDPADVAGGLHELLDAYLEIVRARPEITWLWLRRWLEPANHTELDQRYSLPLYALVEDLLAQAGRAGTLEEPTPHAAIRSIVWAVHGHVTQAATLAPRQAARERREFDAFAHRLVDTLWGPA